MKRFFIAVGLLTALTACSSSSEVAPTETIAAESSVVDAAAVIEISVIVGENSGPDRTETVALGSTVRISLLNSGSEDDFHLHGYDVAAGEEAVIEFVADAAGEFELESHVTGEVLLVITVQ
jgi:transcription elongation GreA/GreB family factor